MKIRRFLGIDARWVALVATGLLLAACGGGGGGSSSPDEQTPPQSSNVSGVAYGSSAISSGTVAVKCQQGSATSQLGADGAFRFTVPADAGACVLQVTDATTGQKLHSVTVGGAIVNVNPASELVVARVAKTDPGQYFTNFGSSAPTGGALATAQGEVQTLLRQSTGITGANVANMMSASFDASAKTNIDAFNAKTGFAQLGDLATVAAYTPAIEDTATVFERARPGSGFLPLVALEWTPFLPGVNLESYYLHLCYGGNTSVGGCESITTLRGRKNDATNRYELSFDNGTAIDDFATSGEMQTAVTQGLAAINDVIRTANTDVSKPWLSLDTVEAVIAAAMASGPASFPDFLQGMQSEFAARGYPSSDMSAPGGSTGGTSTGYRCPTTKPAFSTDWIQSHANYWAAASAHDAYVKCTAENGGNCSTFADQEIRYCSFAQKTCELLVTDKANCPG